MGNDLGRYRALNTRVIDAGGRTVIPGLNDAHTHFIRGGLTYTNEVRWDGVPSLAEGLRRVREQARRTPAPHWVQVIGGWTWAQFAENRHPTLEEINAAAGDTPSAPAEEVPRSNLKFLIFGLVLLVLLLVFGSLALFMMYRSSGEEEDERGGRRSRKRGLPRKLKRAARD